MDKCQVCIPQENRVVRTTDLILLFE